ncbi:hypothetical protein [Psychrobacillus sp. FJAT-51614]
MVGKILEVYFNFSSSINEYFSCSDDYQESFTFTGTVEEILVKEEMLGMKEYGGVDEGRKEGNVYEIPVGDVERYSLGQFF